MIAFRVTDGVKQMTPKASLSRMKQVGKNFPVDCQTLSTQMGSNANIDTPVRKTSYLRVLPYQKTLKHLLVNDLAFFEFVTRVLTPKTVVLVLIKGRKELH